ncbi:MAG TPA: carboxypeptidase-like regulatory domain-containing protein [Gaiellaceae bacterium]|jgi:hypothetical protein|nr:carboxypeptidase-like regulatory domain-containing protein [Gaiellaceae bacterium]
MLVLVVAVVLLHGTVTIGPTTPVCKAGVPCTKPAAHVTLTFVRAGRTLRAATDGLGHYRIALPAGTWRVRASAGMRMAPTSIVVPSARTARRDFAIDTGIR